ncbi:MAG TPA: iron-sulfur cluster assembly scaffold protein [Chloroflexia bacterium]|nr:iron-sulfur cluster assembly scaffold protein [Chloroflexia bacterium]
MSADVTRDDLDMEYVLELASAFDKQARGHVISNPDIVFEDSNPLCGDKFKVQLKLSEAGDIEDVGFTGRGCAISRATAMLLIDEIQGRKLEEVNEITRDQLIDELGIEINSAVRLKCAGLALRTVKTGLQQGGYKVSAPEEEDWAETD